MVRTRGLEDSPGTEWFVTSPDEIDGIVRFISENQSKEAEQGAAPNGGPMTPLGNSGVTEGPPSVS